jgi:NitT/TauT family transport system substrate-binding protein
MITRHLHAPSAALRPALWCVLIATLLFMTGCGPNYTVPLRVGINTWPAFEFFHLAREKGFYHDAGLEIRLVQFSTLSDCRSAFERGQIDVMGSTLVEVLQVRDHSPRSPQVVQVVDYSDGADVILALPGTTGGPGLRGARIGVDLSSLGSYVLACGLEKHGLTLAEVHPVSMDPDSMEAAFRGGELDAVVTFPPTSTRLLRDLNASTLFSSADIPGELVDVISVDAAVTRARPADIARLLVAFHRAQDYTRAHPAEALAIMAAREGVTPQEFSAALGDGIKLVTPGEQASYLNPGGKLADLIGRTDRVLRQSGQLTGPARREDIVNARFINASNPP